MNHLTRSQTDRLVQMEKKHLLVQLEMEERLEATPTLPALQEMKGSC